MKVPTIVRLGLPVALLLLPAATASAQETSPEPTVVRNAEQSEPVTPFVFDGDLRDLPRPAEWKPGDPVKEIPRRRYTKPGAGKHRTAYETAMDVLAEKQMGTPPVSSGSFTTPSRNFPGQGFSGSNPPDTVGEVGPAHYIQAINGGGARVAIYNKAEPTPSLITTFAMDNLGSSNCSSGFGDPIILYDRAAGRWLLSEFSSSGNRLCVYISQTSDPVSGGWFNYSFTAPSFPDYPKYGVWPADANGGAGSYVVTANDGGPGAYALDRGQMLAGNPATFQRLTMPGLPGFAFEAPTPADLDGPDLPSPTAPALIMRHRDTENHSGPAAPGDLLEMWAFDVDWVDSGNTTLTQLPSIDVSEFDSDLCGLTSFFCFPQPSGPTLDPLREVIMFRLVYQSFDEHDSIVGNFVTDVDGSNLGGIRWFELRGGGTSWSLYQEGTYSPDSDNRWMAASAIDQSGNIAVAYNVSSTSTFPSLRYTGRLADDPPGVMTQPEANIHAGTASNSSNRYGDYSAMNLDPADDCTFWFTGMDNTSSNWRTQITSFKFDACGCLQEPSALAVAAQDVGPNQIEITWNDADLETVIEYSVERSRDAGGPYETIAVIADTSPGVASGPGYAYTDTDVSGGTTYYYVVRGSDGVACRSNLSNEAGEVASGACTLPPEFEGLSSVETPFSPTCTLDLEWSAAQSNCGGAVSYNVYRSDTGGFTPGVANLIAEDVGTTTYSDFDLLDSGATYYYIVRAEDQVINVEEGNLVEIPGRALGTLTQGTWTDDAGDTGPAQMVTSSPWSQDPSGGNLGPNVYQTGSYGNSLCAGLTTPELRLGAGSQLTFASRFAIESNWDKGEVQISVDGGLAWTRVPMSYPANANQAADECGFPTGAYFTGTDNTWSTFNADLSAWASMDVLLRFALSTDGSVNAAGWWIDDITITNVDVPGECATTSACGDNPLVNVEPEGPQTVCGFDQPVLAAVTTGGVGPFEYQWTQNDVDIPGATGPTFQPTDAGTHAYNVRTRATTCPSDVTDGLNTVFTTQDMPVFGGLTSVANTQQGVCTVDVQWDPGSSLCPGPVRYFVYRDTTSPVGPVPGNAVASGVSGTSFADSSGLDSGTTYHYLVRAQDATSGIYDDNAVEASAVPDGPGSGIQTQRSDDFESPAEFDDWTVTTGPGAHDCGEWELSDSAPERPSSGSGFYALADNACGPLFPSTSTTLTSPVIDANLTGIQSVTLEYDIFHDYNSGDDATVEVWDGASWVVVWADTDTDLDAHQVLDVTAQAAGNPAFQVRFVYEAQGDRSFAVDNVQVVTDRHVPCSSVAGPPSAPTLSGDRASPAGDVIDVAWDASCQATDYNLIYGDLVTVSSYALSGSQCAIGTSGSFAWNGVPSASLYFLVVGTDGAGVESSWGVDSNGAERNGAGESGQCAVDTKDTANSCP